MIYNKSIYIKNIYYMLCYAFQTLKPNGYKDVDSETFEHIHDLLAEVLCKGVSLQLKRGLYKEYIHHNENLSTVHGKINISETIRNILLQRRSINCDFDDLSPNILHNQIIKTVMELLIRSPNVDNKRKTKLKKNLFLLTNIETINLNTVNWKNITFHKNNQNYKILINVCNLIAHGLLQTNDYGYHKLADFFDEQALCRLYEKFILEYYKQEFHNTLKAEALQIDWALDDNSNDELLPTMKTDITLSKRSRGEQKVLIIDAKFYTEILSTNQHNKKRLHADNLYQIFTYVKNKDVELTRNNTLHEVSGMLLYAKTDEEICPNNSYKMSGNLITVSNLDLNQDFSEIKKQLNKIANEYFHLN